MRVKPIRTIAYDNALMLTDKEYNSILEHANKVKQKTEPLTQIVTVTFALSDYEHNYVRETLSLRISRESERNKKYK
jgi:hypothetical protein